MFVTFEESESDLVENVASIGFDVAELVRTDLIRLDQVTIDRSEMSEAGESIRGA